jgi:hypothetical protein
MRLHHLHYPKDASKKFHGYYLIVFIRRFGLYSINGSLIEHANYLKILGINISYNLS